MLELKNDDLLGEVVEKAIDSARGLPRWVHAIIKAAGILRTGDLTFMTYNEASGELLLVSDGSNNIYSSNGSCQCRAFVDFNQPCWHRAAARLVRRYFERLNEAVPLVLYREPRQASQEIYECQERSCGWRGPWSELGTDPKDHGAAVCPKCDSGDIAEVAGINTSPARLTARIGNYARANAALGGARK